MSAARFDKHGFRIYPPKIPEDRRAVVVGVAVVGHIAGDWATEMTATELRELAEALLQLAHEAEAEEKKRGWK